MQFRTPNQHPGSDEKLDEAEPKLGSAQPGKDLFDPGSPAADGVPVELIAPDVRPVAVVPTEVRPTVRHPADVIPPETRPVDYRPREFFTND